MPKKPFKNGQFINNWRTEYTKLNFLQEKTTKLDPNRASLVSVSDLLTYFYCVNNLHATINKFLRKNIKPYGKKSGATLHPYLPRTVNSLQRRFFLTAGGPFTKSPTYTIEIITRDSSRSPRYFPYLPVTGSSGIPTQGAK